MPQRLDFLSPVSDQSANQNAVTPTDGVKVDRDSSGAPKGQRLDWLSPTRKEIDESSPSKVNPANIEATDPKTGLKIVMNKGAEEIKAANEQFEHAIRMEEGHLPDVDYDKGTDFSDRMALSMSDNDDERRAYLSDKYGVKNVQQDPVGTFYVLKNGKKIAPAGSSIMEGMTADALGHGEELALMARGVAVGGETGGIPGAIIGSMVGAMGGKSFEEMEKKAAGFLRKSPSQESKAITESSVAAGLGEGVATPLAGGIERAMSGNVPSFLSGTTPTTKRLTEQTLGIGGVPPVRSALPTMKGLQYHQSFGEKLTGDMTEKRNLQAVEGEMTNILKSSGMDASKIPEAMKMIMNTSEAPSYSALGDLAKEHATKYQEQAAKAVEDLTANMNKHLNDRLADIQKQIKAEKAGDPDFSQKVAEGIAQNRKEFSNDADKLYGQIDNLVGNELVVPTQPVKNAAKRIYDSIPKTQGTPAQEGEKIIEGENGARFSIPIIKPAGEGSPIFGDPRVLKVLSDVQKLSGKISFSDAQKIRSTLGELGRMEDLTPGVSKKDFNELREAVDQSFDLSVDGQTPQAVALLRKADAFYKEGIRKFEDAGVNRLVESMRTGIYPDASKIVSTIFQKGQAQRAVEVMKMLPEDVRNKVRGEFGMSLMTQAADKTTGLVSGSSLNRSLAGKHDLLEAAYGPKTAKDIELYAHQLAMRDEKIPVNALDKDRVSESIRAAQKAHEALGKFMDDNYLSELANPSMASETVYKHLVQPGKETDLARAVAFFGPKSPQVQKLRETALTDLMHKAIIPTASGAAKTVGAEGLEKALSLYTAKQKALLFPGGLDKDIETLAENAKFLFPSQKGEATFAGLAAGAIKATLPFSAIPFGYGALWNYVLSRPQTIRYLALGLNSGGPARQVALETLRSIVRAGALGMLPDVDENEPRPEQTPR